MNQKKYLSIVSACEAYLDKYGDNYLGVGWTKKKEYAELRYKVMLEVIKPGNTNKIELLDFGCGASHLFEYIIQTGIDNIEYSGLDLSEKFINLSRSKFPSIEYYQADVLSDHFVLPDFDYIVFNGIFTMKCDIPHVEMLKYMQDVIQKMFEKARAGIAFNVMSKQVEWERDDLFHLPFDVLASFLTQRVSRNFLIRHDYGLYEYTTYVYR